MIVAGESPITSTCSSRCVEKIMARWHLVFPRLSSRAVPLSGLAGSLALLLMLSVPCLGASDRAIKTRVSPVYPEIAKRLHVAGIVKVEATVSADGKVTEVKTISGSHMLAPAAEDAVRKWKFAQGDSESTVTVDVGFAMEQ
jgi:TonB family protein